MFAHVRSTSSSKLLLRLWRTSTWYRRFALAMVRGESSTATVEDLVVAPLVCRDSFSKHVCAHSCKGRGDNTYIYIYIYVYVCMRVCVCVCAYAYVCGT